MDANQTKFHLLLGRDDWARCRVWLPERETAGQTLGECWDSSPPDSSTCALHWERERHELTLRPKAFRFTASAGDRKSELGRANDYVTSDRRGAARDRFGNWYFISEDRREILAWSAGCKHTAPFWSCDGKQIIEPVKHGIFEPVEAAPPPPPPGVLSGLAITEDHYLVVGTIGPGERGGLLVFDLHAGGPPRQLCWPEEVEFAPFDMTPRHGGGVWILDRKHHRVWALDRHLRVMAKEQWASPPIASEPDVFQPVAGAQTHATPPRMFPEGISLDAGSPVEGMDPVSIEALPDGTVLILDAVSNGKPSVIWRYKFTELVGQIVLDGQFAAPLEEPEPKRYFRPAYDFAFLPASQPSPPPSPCGGSEREPVVADASQPAKLGDLFVVTSEGNQTFRFDLRAGDEWLDLALPIDFFPMRLFSGMGLVAGGGQVFYDSDGRWVPLVRQDRPVYVEEAVIVSPTFDGREPGCVWHRLMLDACLPPETSVEVWSRTSDEKDEANPFEPLRGAVWQREPEVYRRGNGSELPFMSPPKSPDAGTFELLFQKAQGRYLQLKLVPTGNGRSTPRLRALRIYYPRFSYLKNYLPAVYREDCESASFLDRFLANLEGTNTALEDRIAAVHTLCDWRSAPADTLAWLAQWFGVALDPAWDEPRQRLLIQHAMDFFQWRGTIRGLQMALHLAFDESACKAIFEPKGKRCRCRSSGSAVAAAKKCRTRTDPFRVVEKFLLRRAPAVAFGEPADDSGPQLVDKSGTWSPNKGADDLRRRYGLWIGQKDGSDFRKDWSPFDLTPAPNAEQAAARAAFARRVLGFEPSPVAPDETKRRLWQDFLVRRYIVIGDLNLKHGTSWASFDAITYPTALPVNKALLWDWYQFEALVLATVEAAHRFTVMLPFTGHTLPEVEKRWENLELARRLLDLEKPAHTTFDVKFYWALFRIGEARLGLDTVLGLGGRDPALLPPAVLGRVFLAETQLAATHPFDVTERQIVGRDRLKLKPRKSP